MTYEDIIKKRKKPNEQSQPSESSEGTLSYDDILLKRRAVTNSQKEEQAKADSQFVNQWFEKANIAVGRANGYITNPIYNTQKNLHNYISTDFADVEADSAFVKSYIEKYNYTEKGAKLQSMYSDLTDAMSYYKNYSKNVQDEMSQYKDENSYNAAMKELKLQSKYSDINSYDDYVNAAKMSNDENERKWLNAQADIVATSNDYKNRIDSIDGMMKQIRDEKAELLNLADNASTESEKRYYQQKIVDMELDDRYDKLYAKKVKLNPLLERKQQEDNMKKYYDDVIENNVKAQTLLQLRNLDTGEQITDTYTLSQMSDNEREENSQATKDKRIEIIENQLRADGIDVEKFYKYADRKEEAEYNARQIEAAKKEASEHPVFSSVLSVPANTFGAISDAVKYAGSYFDKLGGGDGYIDTNGLNTTWAQAIRGTVGENIENPVGQFFYDTGMSMADFTAMLPLNLIPGGQALSLSILGTSAGTNAATNVINNGGTIQNAVFTGIAQGVAEAFFEKFSLEQLKVFKNKGTSSLKEFVGNVLKSSFTEGSEEAFTDLANLITDQIINGDNSDFERTYQDYLNKGYSEEEANRAAWGEFGLQLAQSFAGGALSGGVLGGAVSGVTYAKNYSNNRSSGENINAHGNTDELVRIGKLYDKDTQVYKLAQKVSDKQAKGKKVNASVGQLRNLIIEQSKSDFETEYKKVTENLHEDEKVVVDKLLNREALNEADVKIINNNDVLKNNYADFKKKFDNLYSNAEKANNALFEPIKSIDDNTDKIDESKLKVSEDGKTKINDEIYDGPLEVARTNPIAGTVTYKIEKDGKVKEVSSENFEFKTKEEAKLSVLASKYNVHTAQVFLELYENGQDVNEYSREFNVYQNYGRLAVPLTDEKMNIGFNLSPDQKLGAYEAGLTSRKSYYQEQNILTSNAKNSKYYAYEKGNFNASAIKDIKLNDTQKAFYNFFREFALRTGINVELFSSNVIEGEYKGEQGSWNNSTKTIRIDINAGLVSVTDRGEIKHGMLNTFSHELTHIAENSGFYDELHEAIVSTLEKHGKSFNKLVEDKKENLSRKLPNAKSMSDEKLTYLADAEVIADCCEIMLKDSKIFEDIAKGNPTLAQKIRDKLKNFIERLKQLLDKTNALTQEGKFLEECVTDFENILKLWDKAVTDGIKTVNALQSEQKNNTAENGNVKNQLRSIPEEKEIADNIKVVANMKPVATLNGSEFSKSKTDLVTQVTGYFDEIGGYINTEYGKIELTKNGVKSSLGHGIGRNKAIAFKAVPAVLEEGKIIDFQKNWKNRGYDTAVFAAPIKIENKDYFMAAVIVVETERNSYYLHEVAIQEKEDNTLFKTGTVKNGTSGKVLSSPIFTLLQKLQSVKDELSGKEKSLPTTADAKSPASTPETNSGTDSKNSISNTTENVEFQFGGRKAETANNSLLDQAIEMENSGKDSEAIRKETGWFKGYDGKWRFEIDDSKMTFKGLSKSILDKELQKISIKNRMSELEKKVIHDTATKAEENEYYELDEQMIELHNYGTLADYITHPTLFKSYPQLKDVKLKFTLDMSEKGAYNSYINSITLSIRLSDEELKKTLAHEIQHAIQKIEGFASGSNVEYWKNKGSIDPYSNYSNTAGEIEARDTQKRLDYDAEQRKNTRPDIDREDVVFADNNSGVKNQSRSQKRKYAKHGGAFSDSLTSDEWAKFTNAMSTGMDAGLRISDNAILVECEEKSGYQYKLVIYDNEIEDNPLKSVYAIGDIDYNKTTANEIAYFIKKLEDKGYDSKKIFTKLLRNHTKQFGYVLGRYNVKSKQYANIGRGAIKNQENVGSESDGTRVFENAGQGVSNGRIDDNFPLFQMRPDNGFANRRLLANALEKTAQNNYEKNKVKLYKENIDQIDELEARLADVNEKIKKASSVKAAERTREQRTELMKLNNVKKILQDKIVRKDKQLLSLESMEAMQKLIEAEKKKAYHEARVNDEATLKKVRESKDKIIVAEREKRKTMVKGVRDARDKKEIIRKINKELKDIDKLLNRSKADKTVKQGLRDTANKALALSYANISNADIVRQGVESSTPEEQILIREYKNLLDVIESKTQELKKYSANLEKTLAKRNDLNINKRREMLEKEVELKREELIGAEKRKLHQLNSELKDLFVREREQLNKIPVQQTLTELSETYKKTKNAPESYIRNAFDDNIIETIDDLKSEIGATLVKDMNVAQTQKLYKIVTMVLTSIRDANKLHAEDMKLTCEETSNDVMNEILNVKDAKELRNIIANKLLDFQWRNLKPIYAFRLMGSKTFERIYWNLQKGELDWFIDLAEAKQFKEECEKKYGYNAFDFKKTVEFMAMDGSTFTLDLNQMMDIYAASRRPQALQHLLKGGFTFEKDSADGKLKVKTGAKAYPLTMDTIQNIANGLSENEKGYAEEMQKYLSEVMAKKGNEVSMALYGVEMFNEDTYWSISSSDAFLKVEENETTGEFKVKNFSFTKSTIRNASNPIVLKGFEENWCNHVNQMSLYHALTLPLEDFTKVFNYNTGVRTSEENPTAVTGVRSVIRGAFGNSADRYLRQFISDLNGGIREASRIGIEDNMIALAKKASVFANLSVVLQQPSAIFRAMTYVNAKFFLPEPNKLVRLKNHHNDWEQLKKYAPIAGIKEMGMFDTGTGKGVLEWLSSGKRDSVVKKTQNKIDDIGSWLPAKADEYAWVKLWHAIQRETRARYGLAIGTEENLVKSGERFNEVVHLTQVYDSVFSRSGAMRSSQTFNKMATSFMAEPTTVMNMAVDAVVQLKRNGKSGIRQFAKSTSAILVSILANTLLLSIATAGRDDDDDETYSNKYWQAFWKNLTGWGGSLNPLTYYPIMRDLMSVLEGYAVERMDMTLVSDFAAAVRKLTKEDGTTTNNILDFVGCIANLFGLPARNVIRDFGAVINTYNTLTTASNYPITSLEMTMPTDYQEAYDKYWRDGYTEEECDKNAQASVKAKIRKKLRPVYLEALKNQDTATIENIRRFMRDSGFYESLNGVDKVLKGWREISDEEEERAKRAEERK